MSSLTDRLRGIVKPGRALLEPGGHARPERDPRESREPRGDGEHAGANPHAAHEAYDADEFRGAMDRGDGDAWHADGVEGGGPRVSIDTALGGGWAQDALDGGVRCYVVERVVAADRYHGQVQVGAIAETLKRAEAEAPMLANGAPARLPFVFFDLETTGLSGGAGTFAFLVGISAFDDSGAFVTRQYVVPRPADERPMLQAVARRLSTAGALVSFNGRSFDAPLLETRFLYHRLSWTAGRVPHVDVLHPARRFWRQESADGDVSSCSLGTLERVLLGAHRLDDVPGFEVPARYFQFVRSGDARPLAGVLEHNRMDLLSLAGLTARLLRLLNEGCEAAADVREAVALGRVFERAGLPARAVESYERALRFPLPRRNPAAVLLHAEAMRSLALLARRSRRYAEAAAWWQKLLELPGCPRPIVREAAEALAVHHEHRVRDLAAARSFALRTMEVGLAAPRNDAVRHRLDRIERKMTLRTPPGRPLFTD